MPTRIAILTTLATMLPTIRGTLLLLEAGVLSDDSGDTGLGDEMGGGM